MLLAGGELADDGALRPGADAAEELKPEPDGAAAERHVGAHRADHLAGDGELVERHRGPEPVRRVERHGNALGVVLGGEAERRARAVVPREGERVPGGEVRRGGERQLEGAGRAAVDDDARLEAEIPGSHVLEVHRGLRELRGSVVGRVARLVRDQGERHLDGDPVQDLGADVEVGDELRGEGVSVDLVGVVRVVDVVLDAQRVDGEAEPELAEEARLLGHIGPPHGEAVTGRCRHDEAVYGEGSGWLSAGRGGEAEAEKDQGELLHVQVPSASGACIEGSVGSEPEARRGELGRGPSPAATMPGPGPGSGLSWRSAS